tara:strand:- start:20413 stop:21495 length:1083 start_codon:yes stop_codon:yes gene_type:complete
MRPLKLNDITVVIPTLNERENLRVLVQDLNSQLDEPPEILVADGGSTDGTLDYLKNYNIQHIISPSGRAIQMNTAAKTVKTEFILFLHADTRVKDPLSLKRALQLFCAERDRYDKPLAGHFPLRFLGKNKNQHSLFWRYAEEKTDSNRPDSINGDQGLLIERDDFFRLGQFDESLHFLEDQKFSEKVFEEGKWIVLPGFIETSARRFETEGEHQLYILMAIIMGLFKTGFTDFFELAPALYRQQKSTQKLYLTPFFQLIWSIKSKKLGFKKSVIAWYRVGRYIRSHSWQMFYFFDQLARPIYGQRVYPLLWFHDHIFEKFIKHPPANIITGVVAFVWFMGILQPTYWLLERKALKSLKVN